MHGMVMSTLFGLSARLLNKPCMMLHNPEPLPSFTLAPPELQAGSTVNAVIEANCCLILIQSSTPPQPSLAIPADCLSIPPRTHVHTHTPSIRLSCSPTFAPLFQTTHVRALTQAHTHRLRTNAPLLTCFIINTHARAHARTHTRVHTLSTCLPCNPCFWPLHLPLSKRADAHRSAHPSTNMRPWPPAPARTCTRTHADMCIHKLASRPRHTSMHCHPRPARAGAGACT